jgi:prolyl oligopeptidase
VTYKKGVRFDGHNPTILSAYGGFQASELPFYSRGIANIWLKNGGVYVLANIRGGGEYGVDWHEGARKNKRQNGFDDFLSVAEALIHDQVTSPQHLGIQGGSNGGLLVTVAMTQRPDLFRSVISLVPILDMERYTEFGAGPSWIEEYGDPSDPEMMAHLKNYSPLRNVFSDKNHPTLLLTASSKDQRVHPWHGRIMKWLMDQHPNAKTYYIEEEGAGHGIGSDLSEVIAAKSREYAFFAETLGLTIKEDRVQ